MKYLLILILFSASMLNAQEWVSTYEKGIDDYSYSIVVDQQSNSYIAGVTYDSSLNSKILIVKYDPSGNQQWAIVYAHSFPILNSTALVIKYDNIGNLYVGGDIQKTDSGHVPILLKYSTSGSLVWARTIERKGNEQYISDLTLDEAGNPYVLAGYQDTTNFTGGSEVIRYNQQGDTLWTCRDEGSSTFTIEAYKFGNSYVTGTVFENTKLLQCLTFKIDASGKIAWSETYGSNGFDFGYSLCINQTGDVYVTGRNDVLKDVFVIKYDFDGGLTWIRTYNSPENYEEYCSFIQLDNSENVYVAGDTKVNDTISKIILLKYDPSGNRLWAVDFMDTNRLISPNDMFVSGEGNVYITANSIYHQESVRIINLIYNSSGILQWQSLYSTPNEDVSWSLAVDNNGNLFTTGISLNGISHNFSCLTMRYNAPVSILNLSSEIPSKFSLKQNYPNPFNPVTNIGFDVTKQGNVKITVFDILGKEITVIVNEFLVAGSYEVSFNGMNLTSGIYFYKLETGGFVETKKMNLIK